MSYDTTSSNTGYKKGACVWLERKIGRNLLHLSCRHHIFELLVEKIINDHFGKSTSPDIPLFVSFRKVWPTIDKESYEILADSKYF
jgi:hypothetical protein